MLRISPFAALRPQPNQAARVASVPYDVVNTAEARALAAGNPLSFLHVVKPEIDLPDGRDPYDDAVYAKARENLDRLRDTSVLIRDPEPGIYVYRQVMRHRSQVGVVCCCHVEDYLADVIRKHEKTRQDKENDRTRLTLALNANAGPVFLTYRDSATIDDMVQTDMNSRPLYHFNAPDGVTHTVWRVARPEAYVGAFGMIPTVYVADGHHRSASAARAGLERREANPHHTGDERYNWFLSVLFPAGQLNILPYHRLIMDLGAHTGEAALARLGEVGAVTPTDDPTPDRSGVFCVFLDGQWHRLEIPAPSIDRDDPVASLDVALLHERVLGPIFGIGDPRTDPRIDFVGGIRGTAELERRVREGNAAAAFSMYATTIDQLLAVADAGLMMPPKSTWFEPKLRSGLLIHELD